MRKQHRFLIILKAIFDFREAIFDIHVHNIFPSLLSIMCFCSKIFQVGHNLHGTLNDYLFLCTSIHKLNTDMRLPKVPLAFYFFIIKKWMDNVFPNEKRKII